MTHISSVLNDFFATLGKSAPTQPGAPAIVPPPPPVPANDTETGKPGGDTETRRHGDAGITPSPRPRVPASVLPASAVSPRCAPAAAPSAGTAGAGTGRPKAVANVPAGSDGSPRRVTLQLCVDEAIRSDFHRTRDMLYLGRLATLWVATQTDRAAAIRELRHAYELAGLAGEILNVNRQIAAWQLHQLFDSEVVKGLGVSTIRALLPLVKRDCKTGAWTIRPGVEQAARELVARTAAEHSNPQQAREAVARLFPPRKRRFQKQPRRVGRIQREIRHLSPAELAELRDWLGSLPDAAAA